MQYSTEILTDANFDEELEKLCDLIGRHHSSYDEFVSKLSSDYKMQTHDLGFEEWLSCNIKSSTNMKGDFTTAVQSGKLAYQFGNGFIILDFEEVL